jgi:hypothetical protein
MGKVGIISHIGTCQKRETPFYFPVFICARVRDFESNHHQDNKNEDQISFNEHPFPTQEMVETSLLASISTSIQSKMAISRPR